MTYFYAGKFGFINLPTIPIYFFHLRTTLHTVYPYHMACDVNLVISITKSAELKNSFVNKGNKDTLRMNYTSGRC